jgi:hypothetical protein
MYLTALYPRIPARSLNAFATGLWVARSAGEYFLEIKANRGIIWSAEEMKPFVSAWTHQHPGQC